ncbi:MAG: hypothetical protein HOP33_15470 [Verrucomicrobia bacterium]|nr:hypothetical protein [Verrucomicrobiota bacterium]
MKRQRVLSPIVPAVVGTILLLWGLKVMYTSFRFGTLPIAGWETDRKSWFGLTWFIAYFVVLLPAYLYSISIGIESFQNPEHGASPKVRRVSAFGISILLCLLTFCTRVAVTAWFPSPMHVPFEDWKGGLFPGISATIALLLVEAGVLWSIKHQKRTHSNPMPLLLPGGFALILLVWAFWIAYTAFKNGSMPVVGWDTDHEKVFGFAWLTAFVIVLLPAYLYAIGLGILGLLERRNSNGQPVPQNYWLMAIAITSLLCLVTFCTRLAVTAWFPEQMHPPLEHFHGGIIAGIFATSLLALVTGIYYKFARSF